MAKVAKEKAGLEEEEVAEEEEEEEERNWLINGRKEEIAEKVETWVAKVRTERK